MSSSITIGQSCITVHANGITEQMDITPAQLAVFINQARAPGVSVTITSGDSTFTAIHSRWGGMDVSVEGRLLGRVTIRPTCNQVQEAAFLLAYGGACQFTGE